MDHLRHYENVGHVLEVLAQMHADIGKVIADLAAQANNERQQLILEYLADHQSERGTSLAEYHRSANTTLLKQWFQIPFPEDPLDLLASLRSCAPDTVAIQDLISEIDTFIDDLLPHLRDRAEGNDVKKLFQNLLDMDTSERLLRSRALESFSQI